PLAQEETQLKQSTQRDVSTVRFLLSIASALQVCSQFPQCVQASLLKVIRKNEWREKRLNKAPTGQIVLQNNRPRKTVMTMKTSNAIVAAIRPEAVTVLIVTWNN